MVSWLHYLGSVWERVQVPLCFGFSWLFVGMLLLTLGQFLRELIQRSQQMHQIPCTGCQFFTESYRLKCTVNPLVANTEAAIDCSDYRKQEGW